MKLISVWRYPHWVAKAVLQPDKYLPMSARCFVTETTAVESSDGKPEVGEVVVTEQKKSKVPCPENARLMKVAIIGVPNAGKSTITNALTNFEVCPVSKRPHTTRKNQKAVYLDDVTQLVFVDTPGLVNVKEIKKFSLPEEFVFGPEKSIGSSHLVAVIHDVSNVISREKLDFRIKRVLQKFPDKKSILILNKIDLIKQKSTLLEAVKYLTCGIVGGKPLPLLTFEEKKESHRPLNTEAILSKAKERYEHQEALKQCLTPEEEVEQRALQFFTPDEIKKGLHQTGWSKFDDIFMVSAVEGDGIDLLRRYMIINAPEPGWLYTEDVLTDVPPEKLFLSILRAKLLDHLPQEIPFSVQPAIDYWEDGESGNLVISCKLRCPKERYKWRIIGTNGTLIKRITNETERSLSAIFFRQVNLTLDPVYDKDIAKNLK